MTEPTWTNRRRAMIAVGVFCMGVIAFCLGMNLTGEVAETAVSFAFVTLSTIVGSYVFGAAWQDISLRK